MDARRLEAQLCAQNPARTALVLGAPHARSAPSSPALAL